MIRQQVRVNFSLPTYFQKFDPPARYKLAYGGRGAAKTWGFGRKAIRAMMKEKMRFLFTRELQSSIADSIHRLLVDQIDLMGVTKWWRITDTELECRNGSLGLFKGLRHNTREIKSLEGIDRVLVEEAEKMSDESWEILIPTIRKDNSEIWINLNPDLETDPTYQRFIVNTPPSIIREKVTYADNPGLPQVLRDEMEYLKRVDFERYLHVWEGHTRKSSDAQIMNGKWTIETFDAILGPDGVWRINGEVADGPYYGLDFGFSADPTAGVRMFIVGTRLFITHELWRLKLEVVDTGDALKAALPGVEHGIVRADSARPETISHLSGHAKLDVRGVEKGKGSVEDGISFLRSFEKIVIHERCKHMVDEAKNYSWKIDRLTGEITTDIVDKHNHLWDAVRYGLEPIIKRTGDGMGLFNVMRERARKLKEQQNERKT